MSQPKFPFVRVKIIGEDGNAFFILARVKREMNKAGITAKDQADFLEEATAGNYDALLATVMRWVNVY